MWAEHNVNRLRWINRCPWHCETCCECQSKHLLNSSHLKVNAHWNPKKRKNYENMSLKDYLWAFFRSEGLSGHLSVLHCWHCWGQGTVQSKDADLYSFTSCRRPWGGGEKWPEQLWTVSSQHVALCHVHVWQGRFGSLKDSFLFFLKRKKKPFLFAVQQKWHILHLFYNIFAFDCQLSSGYSFSAGTPTCYNN